MNQIEDPISSIMSKYLDIENLVNVRSVNTLFKSILDDPDIWQYLLMRDFDMNGNDPRDLYIRLYTYKPAVQYDISLGSGKDLSNENVDDLSISERNSIIKTLPDTVKRGDIIHVEEYGDFRNDGILMWDNGSLVNLDSDINTYGCVPNSFTIGDEFMPRHWMYLIQNYFIWIDSKRFGKQMLNNIEELPNGEYMTTFIGKLGKFTLLFVNDEDLSAKDALKQFRNDVSYDSTILSEFNNVDETIDDPRTMIYRVKY